MEFTDNGGALCDNDHELTRYSNHLYDERNYLVAVRDLLVSELTKTLTKTTGARYMESELLNGIPHVVQYVINPAIDKNRKAIEETKLVTNDDKDEEKKGG